MADNETRGAELVDGEGQWFFQGSRPMDPQGRKERERLRSAKRYAESMLRWQEVKARVGCQNCGESEPVCLEFHHLDPTTKSVGRRQSISSCLTWNHDRLMKEVQGCIVLCSNCHRKVTHRGLDVSHIAIPDYRVIWQNAMLLR